MITRVFSNREWVANDLSSTEGTQDGVENLWSLGT